MPPDKTETYYAVAKGTKTGIFMEWIEWARHVQGIPDNIHQKFKNIDSAKEYLAKFGINDPTIYPEHNSDGQEQSPSKESEWTTDQRVASDGTGHTEDDTHLVDEDNQQPGNSTVVTHVTSQTQAT